MFFWGLYPGRRLADSPVPWAKVILSLQDCRMRFAENGTCLLGGKEAVVV